MAGEGNSSGSPSSASSLSYDELFSVLMYYFGMSKEDIMNSSRKFIYALYSTYPNRACENLGVSNKQEEKKESTDTNGYPSKFVSFSQEERKKYIAESGQTDEDFIAQFESIRRKARR